MAYRQFVVPRDIFYGQGAFNVLATMPGERVLIVTYQGVRGLGLVERAEEILRTNKTEIAVFDRTELEPSKSTVCDVFSIARDFQPDLIIGLGGGSSIDAGKMGWVLYEHPDLATRSLPEIVQELPNRTLRHKAKYAGISTTSGTGSEASCIAVINNHDVEPTARVVLRSLHMVPDIAVADPELASSMPPGLTANTGFDAMIHALESYVLTPPSGLIDSLAIGAAKAIWEWLPRAVADGKDMQARDKMHLAALQAGMSFSNGRLGLVHVPADQIDVAFGIPHGMACALMLCPAFAFLYPSHKARLSSLAASLGIAGVDDQTKVANLLTGLDQLKQKVGIPLAIKETGQEENYFQAKLDSMADGYMKRISPLSTTLTPDARRAAGMLMSTAEAKELFTHAWNGTRAELR